MAKLKVFVVAEGPSEIGTLDALTGGGRRGSGRRAEGFIPPLLRKLLARPLAIEAQRVMNLGRWELRPSVTGHGNRAAKALALAASDGCALLVFVKDVDREPGTKKSAHERKKKLAKMHAEIEAGFAAVRDANDVHCVTATPCRMIEAWALGDPAALRAASGSKRGKESVPPRPEDLWGRESDPASGHPKCVLERLLGETATAEIFEALAEACSPATLRRTCPESFATFERDLDAVARRLPRISA